MRLGPYLLRTPWWAVVIALALAGFLAALGLWQLGRAEEKAAILAEFAEREARPVTALPAVIDEPEAWRFRRLSAQGRFLGERQFLLDNQVRQGRVGYSVLTPLRLAGSGRLVLIDRGWVPQGRTREERPDVSITGAPVEVAAQAYVAFDEPYRLGGLDEGEAGWPRRVQYVDLAALGERLGEPLLPVLLRLDPRSAHGYLREWDTVPFTPERHLAYALQWFGLSVVLLVIFVAAQLRRVDGVDDERDDERP